jgi:lysophospholipase L1-like esterase
VRDFDLIFRNKPDADYIMVNSLGETRAVINSQGFRDYRDFSAEKPAGVYRILCIGDSSTFGLFVNQGDSYPAQLQTLLDKRQSQWHYNVINAGCAGYSSFNALRALELYGPRFHPDLVILSVGANDFSRKSNGIPDRERDNRSGPLVFFRRLIFNTNTYLYISQIANNMRKPADATSGPRVSPEDYRENLTAFVHLARELGERVIFCPISVPPLYEQIMRQVAEENRVTFWDSETSLRRAWLALQAGADNYEGIKVGKIADLDTRKIEGLRHSGFEQSYQMRTQSWVMEDVAHPNAIGYRAIAEDLAALIP